MLNINKYHVIPIIHIIWAAVRGATSPVALTTVELETPHEKTLSVPFVEAEKRGKDESNITIYGIDYPNTLYSAHSSHIHTLLSQPGSGASGLPFAPLPPRFCHYDWWTDLTLFAEPDFTDYGTFFSFADWD